MTAFCSNNEFLKRYSAQIVGDLVSDDGTRVSSGSLASDANLTAALEDASGAIMAAALRGQRYAESDLAGLTGNGGSYLKRLTADLAIYYLVCRRGLDVAAYPQAEKVTAELERIENGERVFDLDDVEEAGHAIVRKIELETFLGQNRIEDSRLFPLRRDTTN